MSNMNNEMQPGSGGDDIFAKMNAGSVQPD